MANKFLTMLQKSLNSVSGQRSGGWFPFIKEPFTGAWQQNKELCLEDSLSYPAVYACMTLISNDISKLGLKLMRLDENDIWTEIQNSSYSPVLRKPNGFQTRIQFYSNWVLSILTHGNTYVLVRRDARGVVNEMFILDPSRVQVLIADNGEVFYDLSADNVSSLEGSVRVPASEIIHDRMNCLYHPLIGVSPLYAAACTVHQGMQIINSSDHFFANHSRPGGILTAPGAVTDETVQQLKTYWETNYTGNNAGKVAVLADGLTYQSFNSATASDSQVIEQLKWDAEIICSVFHVPPYMIGVGPVPLNNNVQALTLQYYAQALQVLIENMELCLKEGLSMSHDLSVEFDVDTLLRMDTKTLIESEEIGTKSGIKKLNEARKRLNLAPMDGGDTAYLQQQMFSVLALAKRDAKDDPFAKESTNSSNSTVTPANENNDEEEVERFASGIRQKAAERFTYV